MHPRKLPKLVLIPLALTFVGASTALHAAATNPQPAILSTTGTTNLAVVFPDPGNSPTQNVVPGLPANASPHGVSYFGSDNALISDFAHSRIFVVQISTASLVSTIDTATAGYGGYGTIAVAPNRTTALAMGDSNKLYVIQAPFGTSSAITSLTLPDVLKAYQTQAIVFNNAGRAFVYHVAGISVLDPPYDSVAFTIPVTNTVSGALAISPDGNTLLATRYQNGVLIFSAPFSTASTPSTVTVPDAGSLDGIVVAPDGGHAIVVSAYSRQAASIAAPFGPNSTVASFTFPGTGTGGFEDVSISADSQLAILAGGSDSTSEPPYLVRAPFTSAAVVSALPINGSNPSRGFGSVRFLPPGLAPGLTISKSAPTAVQTGTNLTYTISYANTGTISAAGVVIRDSLPAGSTFVSATNGGTLTNNVVVFNIGAVNAGATAQTVSFTVNVTAAAGASVNNNNYTIEATGVAPIAGPPVTTSVTSAPAPPSALMNISTRLSVLTNDSVMIGGIIINGATPFRVIFRAVGNSLKSNGQPFPGRLADPTLELHDSSGAIIAFNDNWGDAPEPERTQIMQSGLQPDDPQEPAILRTLTPGAYTAIVRGKNGTTGVAVFEGYDANPTSTATGQLANLSTRGFVDTNDNVMIGGAIVGSGAVEVVVRGLGPSLNVNGVPIAGRLTNPTLQVFNSQGTTVAQNDDWQSDPAQAQSIQAVGLAPSDSNESAIRFMLPVGATTFLLRGYNGGVGIGLVEIYKISTP